MRSRKTKMNKKQVMLAVFLVLLIGIIHGWAVEPIKTSVILHTVNTGETVWEVAARYCPPSMTMDEYMAIVKYPRDRVVQPGDLILIPVVERRYKTWR